MLGCVCQDANGRQTRISLRAYGVDVRRVRRAAPPTGVALVVVEPGGENIIVVARGANMCLAPSGTWTPPT
jgi:ribokinase